MILDQMRLNIKLLGLDEGLLEEFLQFFHLRTFHKNELFVREGFVCNEVGLIKSGCLWCYYNREGKEVIDEFSMEKEFISDYGSFLTRTPADKNIKCLEDTEMWVISRSEMQEAYQANLYFEKVGRVLAESLFIHWQQKAKSLMLDDAETRYLKLIENRPSLVQRVPQYLIASYLNIKPETLSRIRKKMADKKN